MSTEIASVHPDPTPEELAAIVAAVELLSMRSVVAPEPARPSRWRFSGRWWSKPLPIRRNRPLTVR